MNMYKTKTKIAGIDLPSILMNASGCRCTTIEQLDNLYNHPNVGCVVTKSGTIEERKGNEHPRLFVDDDNHYVINSMGLPNPGYKYYTNYINKINSDKVKPIMQSIYSFSYDEVKIMLNDINNTSSNLIELNITCPNLIGKDNSISTYFKSVEMYMDYLHTYMSRSKLKIGLKMAPMFQLNEFDVMSNLLLKYEIPFITAVNTLPNCLAIDIDNKVTRIRPNNGLGGMSGKYLKPIALANVYNYSRRLGDKVDIIGCGGVTTGIDVCEYIYCGAKAIQIGSTFLIEGNDCFNRIVNEYNNKIMIKPSL